MPQSFEPLGIPTSAPLDSYRAYEAYDAPTTALSDYQQYDTIQYVPVRPIIQRGYQATAPVALRRNPQPEMYQEAPQPYQLTDGPSAGFWEAPPTPKSDPGLDLNYIQIRAGNQSYEYIGARAPGLTAAIESPDGECW